MAHAHQMFRCTKDSPNVLVRHWMITCKIISFNSLRIQAYTTIEKNIRAYRRVSYITFKILF